MPDYLRHLTDAELEAVVAELEERAEQFSADVRMAVNDELRRRRMRTLAERKRR
jgi:hypothetical protein